MMNLNPRALITFKLQKLALDLYWFVWVTITQCPQLDSKWFQDIENSLFFCLPLVLNTMLNTKGHQSNLVD